MERPLILILAAGRGKRIGLEVPKVTLSTDEQPLLHHVLSTASTLQPSKLLVVTGYMRELTEACAQRGAVQGLYPTELLEFVHQPEQLGTGDAVRCAAAHISTHRGAVVILSGDVPLIQPETLKFLLDRHRSTNATVSLLSFGGEPGAAYGRVFRDPKSGLVERIVEAKDCAPSEALHTEYNSGIYVVEAAFLAPAVRALKNENAQKEYYLTDIVAQAAKEGQTVASHLIADASELFGVNTLTDLAEVNRVLLRRRVTKLISSGVRVDDPSSFYVDSGVTVAPGCRIGPNTQLRGATTLASRVTIEGSAFVKDSHLAEDVTLRFSVRLEEAIVQRAASVGPFAHLRPGTILHSNTRVGNFVETKNAELKEGAKASHLSYLGDCVVGSNSNIGAGTITCNFDGFAKHRTTIGDEVFVGSDSCFVAPVTVGARATIGAGSVITKDVPPDALSLSRPEQVTKEGWAARKRMVMSTRGGKTPRS